MDDFAQTFQSELINNSQKYKVDDSFLRKRWWNCKFYKRKLPFESDKEQIDTKDNKEIPIERKLFDTKPNGRFSLGNAHKVAYFSEDLTIAWEEITKEFREELNRTHEKRQEYYGHKYDPTPELMGSNLGVKISESSLLLNLYPTGALALLLEKLHPGFIEDVLLGTNYAMTQVIAKIAHQNGFDGIIYKSARSFKDDNLIDTNLVMFNSEKVNICWPLFN